MVETKLILQGSNSEYWKEERLPILDFFVADEIVVILLKKEGMVRVYSVNFELKWRETN